jgi:hypothetical protein
MRILFNDFRLAARTLRKSPAFTVTALATIGLCLGANLTVFAVVDSMLLRPLPFPDAGRLVTAFNSYRVTGSRAVVRPYRITTSIGKQSRPSRRRP